MTRVIGIVSGKGGVGKTTFAANLGIALSNFGKKAVVIDCNVTAPHLAYYLGARNYSITLNDILKGEIDVKFAPTDKSGVMFIPCSEDIKDVLKVDIDNLKKHINKLTESDSYDYIILDSAPGLGREAIATLKACNEIIFVTTPTIPNIMDVTRCAEVANQLGHRRFSMVLNMVRGKDFELRIEDAQSIFGTPVLGMIPFDESVMDSTAQGIPYLLYKNNSRISDHFMGIAANLIGIEYRKKHRFGFLGRLFGK